MERLALTERACCGPERVGEVAAHLALDANRHDGPVHRRALHAVRHSLEGIRDVGTDARLCQGSAELLASRFGGIPGHCVESLRKSEPAAEARRDEKQDLRQL